MTKIRTQKVDKSTRINRINSIMFHMNESVKLKASNKTMLWFQILREINELLITAHAC